MEKKVSRDVLMSLLQKAIRRGEEKLALWAALRLYEINLFTLLRRLRTIAVEDIFDTTIQLLVFEVCAWVEKNPYADLAWLGTLIIKMCRASKSREGDDIINELCRDIRNGREPDIPDWAFDQHTHEGRRLGRGPEHFWQEGAKLENEHHPSKYTPYTPEEGDGYHYPDGSRWEGVPKPGLPSKKSNNGQLDLF